MTASQATEKLTQYDALTQKIVEKIKNNDHDTLIGFMSIIDDQILPMFYDITQEKQVLEMVWYDQLKTAIDKSINVYLQSIHTVVGRERTITGILQQYRNKLMVLIQRNIWHRVWWEWSLTIVQKNLLRELFLLRDSYIDCLETLSDKNFSNNRRWRSFITQLVWDYSYNAFTSLKDADR